MESYYGKSGSLGLSIVKWCLAPCVTANFKFNKFIQVVTAGKRSNVKQQKRLTEIWQKASRSIGCEPGGSLGFEAKLMVDGLQQVRDAIKLADGKILQVCLHFPEYSYLLTIPGFGPDVSSKVLAGIGNPFRFDSGKQVLKMAGMDLSAKRSGKKFESVILKLSKKGKAPLRYALYQAATIASSRNEYFVTYFTNKLRGREREKGIKTKMKVKLAAKLLVITWTLMKKEVPFCTP
jgi:transposase